MPRQQLVGYGSGQRGEALSQVSVLLEHHCAFRPSYLEGLGALDKGMYCATHPTNTYKRKAKEVVQIKQGSRGGPPLVQSCLGTLFAVGLCLCTQVCVLEAQFEQGSLLIPQVPVGAHEPARTSQPPARTSQPPARTSQPPGPPTSADVALVDTLANTLGKIVVILWSLSACPVIVSKPSPDSAGPDNGLHSDANPYNSSLLRVSVGRIPCVYVLPAWQTPDTFLNPRT